MNRWMIATIILAVMCLALAGTSVVFYRTPETVTTTTTAYSVYTAPEAIDPALTTSSFHIFSNYPNYSFAEFVSVDVNTLPMQGTWKFQDITVTYSHQNNISDPRYLQLEWTGQCQPPSCSVFAVWGSGYSNDWALAWGFIPPRTPAYPLGYEAPPSYHLWLLVAIRKT